MTCWDVAIIGGGSAGCVLANRLSASGRYSVLLIEAGPDVRAEQVPPELLDSYSFRSAFDPRYQWHRLPVRPTGSSRPRHYEQARVLGGGSSMNGQQANRGLPADYDGWAQDGAVGWGWEAVLPWFRRVESDRDYTGPLHGQDGPVTITRIPRSAWPGFPRAVATALEARGAADIGDQNGVFGDGFFPMALSNDGRHRVSAVTAYLPPAVRTRANLCVLPETEVAALHFEGARAIGCRTASGQVIRAREVILCAGALHSPQLLLRAGVGPGPMLAARGIPVRADRPGVGANLSDHPAVSVSTYLHPAGRVDPAMRRHAQMAVRYSSGVSGCPASDMYTVVVGKSAWHGVGQRIGSLFTWINTPFSRGSVTLDAALQPDIRLGFLDDHRDLLRLTGAVRHMASLLTDPALSGVADDPFASALTGLARRVRLETRVNAALTWPTAWLLDGPAWLRRRLIRHVFAPGPELSRLVADPARLESHVRATVTGGWHPVGTCRMGPADDLRAVVDPADGSVHGIAGLRVVDASIMPSVPRANTNLPTLMLAEKMADAILACPDRSDHSAESAAA